MTTIKSPTDKDAAYVRDTEQHISLVGAFMGQVTRQLAERAAVHDASKFHEPERSIFAANTHRRDGAVYGSKAYTDHMKTVNVALNHHYANNRHHPEFHEGGISSMNLMDVIEMVCDWMAASMRDANGDPERVRRAIAINQARFGYTDELAVIMNNTVTDLLTEPGHTKTEGAG